MNENFLNYRSVVKVFIFSILSFLDFSLKINYFAFAVNCKYFQQLGVLTGGLGGGGGRRQF